MVEVEKDNTRGIAVGGLTTGIIGTALSVLNGGIPGIVGNMNGGAMCSENLPVNRYEAGQNARIAALETEVKLRDANFYTLSEMGKFRDYVDRRFECIEGKVNTQAVINAQVTANLSCMQGQIATLMGLTKTVIPIGSVCPEPMARYNSWVAPAAEAPAGG